MTGPTFVLRLRDVREDDLPILFEQQKEPEANRLAAFPPREHDVFTAHWRKLLGDTNVQKQAIVVDDQVAGNIGSWEQDDKRLVSYWIGQSYWGRGIATAALAAFLAHHEKTRPLFAHVVVHNLGSIRVLEKCGFVRVGKPSIGSDGLEELLMRLTAST